MNFAMHKNKPGTLAIKKFVARDNAFSFISSVKGTPAYWKQFLCDVLAMVKQLGIPTYFMTLPYADLRWENLLHIINKLNNLGLIDVELGNLSYRCNLLSNNPVLVARHFQYKVKYFSKKL